MRLAATPIDSLAPVLYAIRTGMFEKAGLKIELTMMSSGNVVSQAVVGGAVDIGLSSLVAIIQGHLRGIAFTIIAPGGMWIDSDTAGVVVVSGSPIKNARDFNGKTIGTNSLQSLDTVAMDAWVDQNGGDSKTVRFFELPALAAAAALTQGRIDGAILGTPAYAAARADGKARTVGRIYDAVAKQFLLGVWFTMNVHVQANRSAAERFSKVVAEAPSRGRIPNRRSTTSHRSRSSTGISSHTWRARGSERRSVRRTSSRLSIPPPSINSSNGLSPLPSSLARPPRIDGRVLGRAPSLEQFGMERRAEPATPRRDRGARTRAALDVGSGEGADAIWLAERGWRVTAVDISAVALVRGAAIAAKSGAEVAERIE